MFISQRTFDSLLICNVQNFRFIAEAEALLHGGLGLSGSTSDVKWCFKTTEMQTFLDKQL